MKSIFYRTLKKLSLTSLFLVCIHLYSCPLQAQTRVKTVLSGTVVDEQGNPIVDAFIYIKRSPYATFSNKKGEYQITLKPGKYDLFCTKAGFVRQHRAVNINSGEALTKDFGLKVDPRTKIEEVYVRGKSTVQQVQETPFNVVALDARKFHNSNQEIGRVLNKASGVRIRESGGLGSDMQVMMDGFAGKHIKVFIDGIPQEGVGSSFGLNNIPVNFAERIEIYKGVVPVEFGTDAMGGVINIVTKKRMDQWYMDASYSFGSFQTHRSYLNLGITDMHGLHFELGAFQNSSDNSYYTDTPVKDFKTGAIDRDVVEHVKRFNDAYHNEAIMAKIGYVNKPWADRLLVGFTFSNMHKNIQTGVRQEIVFGAKYRKGHAILPSLEYMKKDLLIPNLNVRLTANYNRNISENVDTSSYEYNWRHEQRPLTMPGEQVFLHLRSENENYNATFNANYNIGKQHHFSLNHILNHFERDNKSLLGAGGGWDPITKQTKKNVSGLSYRYAPTKYLYVDVFGKYFNQYVSGPIAKTSTQDVLTKTTTNIDNFGYGAAASYFIIKNLQAKLSYEHVNRLPTIEELFGDEDLESGRIGLKPEKSHNLNANLSYQFELGRNNLYVEGGLVYRDIEDYIRRNIEQLGGGKVGGTFVNHGKVLTKGYNLSARYHFAKHVIFGAGFTQMDVRDNVETMGVGTLQKNLTYKSRIPNLPYRFANMDLSIQQPNLLEKGSLLTLTYDNLYMHGFPLYSEALGSESRFVVPSQFSHNLMLAYSFRRGKYNLSFECQNFTNEKLYDNFSLQKAGRAFYAKLRIALHKHNNWEKN